MTLPAGAAGRAHGTRCCPQPVPSPRPVSIPVPELPGSADPGSRPAAQRCPLQEYSQTPLRHLCVGFPASCSRNRFPFPWRRPTTSPSPSPKFLVNTRLPRPPPPRGPPAGDGGQRPRGRGAPGGSRARAMNIAEAAPRVSN